MKLLKFYPTLALGYALLPLIVGAQGVNEAVSSVGTTLQRVVSLLFVLATIIFLWGVIQFVASAGDEQKRTKAKGIMTWGIIGLAVMAAAWGVSALLTSYFGVSGSRAIPTRPGEGLQP